MLERHQQIFHVLSLNPAGLEIDKVVYLEGILDKDYFGLSTDIFNERHLHYSRRLASGLRCSPCCI